MKSIFKISVWAFLLSLAISSFFIGANESYSFKDARQAFEQWRHSAISALTYYDSNWFLNQLPVGVGSVSVSHLGGKDHPTTASGASLQGNALAVYVTPDIFPAVTVLSFVAMSVSLVLFGIGSLIGAYNRRNELAKRLEYEKRDQIF